MNLNYNPCKIKFSSSSSSSLRSVHLNHEGRLGISDGIYPSGILRLSFDSLFLFPLLLFCLVHFLFLFCHVSVNGQFSRFFSRKTQILFVKLGLFVWFLLSSLEIIAGRWYVQLAAIWHGIYHYAFK